MTHPYWAYAPAIPRHAHPYSELLEGLAGLFAAFDPPRHRAEAAA